MSNNYQCKHHKSHEIRNQKHRTITSVCITAIEPANLAMDRAVLSTTISRWHAVFIIAVDLLFTIFFQPVNFSARIFTKCRITIMLIACAITVTPWLVWVTKVTGQCFTWKQTVNILHCSFACLWLTIKVSKPRICSTQHKVKIIIMVIWLPWIKVHCP